MPLGDVTEEEGPVAKQICHHPQVGEAAGIDLMGLVTTDPLVVVALGIVGLGTFQGLWSELLGVGVQQCLAEQGPEALVLQRE